MASEKYGMYDNLDIFFFVNPKTYTSLHVLVFKFVFFFSVEFLLGLHNLMVSIWVSRSVRWVFITYYNYATNAWTL